MEDLCGILRDLWGILEGFLNDSSETGHKKAAKSLWDPLKGSSGILRDPSMIPEGSLVTATLINSLKGSHSTFGGF